MFLIEAMWYFMIVPQLRLFLGLARTIHCCCVDGKCRRSVATGTSPSVLHLIWEPGGYSEETAVVIKHERFHLLDSLTTRSLIDVYINTPPEMLCCSQNTNMNSFVEFII